MWWRISHPRLSLHWHTGGLAVPLRFSLTVKGPNAGLNVSVLAAGRYSQDESPAPNSTGTARCTIFAVPGMKGGCEMLAHLFPPGADVVLDTLSRKCADIINEMRLKTCVCLAFGCNRADSLAGKLNTYLPYAWHFLSSGHPRHDSVARNMQLSDLDPILKHLSQSISGCRHPHQHSLSRMEALCTLGFVKN